MIIKTAKNSGRVSVGIAAAIFFFADNNVYFRLQPNNLCEDRWIHDSIRNAVVVGCLLVYQLVKNGHNVTCHCDNYLEGTLGEN